MTDAVSTRGIPISASEARARPVVAERLREARRARGLSREQVAAEPGVSRSTLVNVEQGRRAPRPEELVTLARLYGRRVHELTRASRPVLSVTARFRSADGTVSGDTAAAIDDLQRLADDVAALEESVGASASRRYPEPHDTAGLPLDLAAQQVAGAERQRLDLGGGPLLRLRQVLEDDVGIRVFAIALAPEVAGLFALAEPAGACVAVNAAHPHERQRWTLAHEYAHFLTARTEPEVTRLHLGRASRDERLADAFAGHFLMPTTGVTRRFQDLRRSRGTFTTAELLQMAATYEVSAEAMAHRLEGLRLVGSGWWDRLKDQGLRVDQARAVVGLPALARDTQAMPTRVQYLAVEAYLKDLLSEGQLSSLLRLDRLAARRLIATLGGSFDIDNQGDRVEILWHGELGR